MRTGLEVSRKPVELALQVWGRVRIIPISTHREAAAASTAGEGPGTPGHLHPTVLNSRHHLAPAGFG